MLIKLILIIVTLLSFNDFWVSKKKRHILILWCSYLSAVAVIFYKHSKIADSYFNETEPYYWVIIPLVLFNSYQVFSKWKEDGKFSNKCFLNSVIIAIAITVGIVLI